LQVLREYSCSTGDKKGDKAIEGDERTPEGVYFLERRLNGGLNESLYGGVAYTLNYPNPIDRLEGKTGYGIWLHGRGKALVPRDTKGCIALQTPKLRGIADYIQLGETPIIIGSSVEFSQKNDALDQTATALHELVQQWAEAWQSRSERFFSFYHHERFVSESSGFEAFRSRKKRLFDQYSWIEIFIRDVRAIPGPDYWVTYFPQLFRSPSFSSQGIKRLYWQLNGGQWRIVGSEWIDKPLHLEEEYLDARRPKLREWLQAWRSSWERADMEAYRACYHPEAQQNDRAGRDRIVRFKQKVWSEEPPQRISLEDVSMRLHANGFAIRFEQSYRGEGGYEDRGRKTLVVEPFRGRYRILSEQWTALSAS
jgi:murein L,D-transpeptidase YafK